MAKTKYKVQKDDNWAKLGDPLKLMAMNPGVPKLSQGQTIFLPSTTGSQTPYGPPKPPGYGNQTYGPPKPPIFMTAAMLPQTPLPQNLYGPPPAPVAPTLPTITGVQGNANQNINYSTNNSTNTPAAASPTTLPAGYVYQGGMSPEAIEQRRQWNLAAGGDPAIFNDPNNRVFVLTRAQIRAMKEAQARRQGGWGVAKKASVVTPVNADVGNAVNTSLSWRVG